MILAKKPDIDRFLAQPGSDIRAVLLYGKDRAVVRERADLVAAKSTQNPDDPFDVAVLTETDLSNDSTRLVDELAAMSLMGGRRLVRLKLTGEKGPVDKAAADALKQHVDGLLNGEAMLLIEAGALAKDSALRKAAEVPGELDQEGAIKAKFMSDAFNRRGGCRPARDLADRICGQDIQQKECDKADTQQDQHRLQQAAQDVGGHYSRPRWVGSSTSRSASPTRLKASASKMIAAPGMNTSHGADWK